MFANNVPVEHILVLVVNQRRGGLEKRTQAEPPACVSQKQETFSNHLHSSQRQAMIQRSRSSVLQLKLSFSWLAHQPQNSSKWEMYLNLDKSLFCPARTLSSLVSIILHTLAHSLYVATRQRRFVALISLRSTIKLPALSARSTRTEKAWNMTPSIAISPTDGGFLCLTAIASLFLRCCSLQWQ